MGHRACLDRRDGLRASQRNPRHSPTVDGKAASRSAKNDKVSLVPDALVDLTSKGAYAQPVAGGSANNIRLPFGVRKCLDRQANAVASPRRHILTRLHNASHGHNSTTNTDNLHLRQSQQLTPRATSSVRPPMQQSHTYQAA